MKISRWAGVCAALLCLTLLPGCGSDSNEPAQTTQTEKDASWAKHSVFYEVFVRSFNDSNGDGIGDLAGVTAKLDYLQSLGVDALWLMPIHPASSYHGYDVIDHGAINPDYGTLDDFKKLVDSAHERKMKIVIDWVVNHTSNEHVWFKKALAGDADYVDYYLWSDTKVDDNWQQAANGRWYYCWYGNANMPKLNYKNAKLRENIKSLAAFWIKQGVDGFRLDVAQDIGGSDASLTYGWWNEFNSYVKSLKPSAYVVGEVNHDGLNDNTYHAPFYQGMDSTFNFPNYNFMLGMSTGLTRDLLGTLNAAHDEYAVYNSNYIDATTLGNHDRSRIASRLKSDPRLVRHAITLMMTLPGTPFLYYGEEIGMRGGHDQQGDPNKREPMDWYASATGAGMTKMTRAVYGGEPKNLIANDGISVEEQQNAPDSLLNYYRKLITLRKAHPMLFDGRYQRIGTPDDTYGYRVSAAGTAYTLLVVHNQDIRTVKTLTLTGAATELLSGKAYKAGETVSIPEFGSVILKVDSQILPIAPMPILNKANPTYKLTLTVHVPPQTPENAPLYLPNSDDGWDPTVLDKCAKCTLTKTGPQTYTITLERERGTILEYKYIRDLGWNSSESELNGDWNGNREAVFALPDAKADDTVLGWRDTNYHPVQ